MQPQVKMCPHLIGSVWSSEGPFAVRSDPADNRRPVYQYPLGTADDARRAVDAAAAAFKQWAEMPPAVRSQVLWRFVELAKARVDELGSIMALEAGKTLAEGRGEALKGIQIVEYFYGAGMRLRDSIVAGQTQDVEIETRRFPLGVACIITPWNFPWAVPLWKMVVAFVTGNTVVWKPSPLTPGTSVRIAELFLAAGLPHGVLNLVHGGGEVGEALIMDPRVQAVSFTGSTAIGRKIRHRLAQRDDFDIGKYQAELGGKNAVVVDEDQTTDSQIDRAVEGVVIGAFGSAGQRCTATSRMFVPESLADRFIDKLLERVRQIKVGPGMLPQVTMGPLSSPEHLDSVMAMVVAACKRDVLVLECGGQCLTEGDLAHGNFMQPTVFVGHGYVTARDELCRQEVFGPVLVVIRVSSFFEALGALNDTEYGLSAALYSDDITNRRHFVQMAHVGMVHLNKPTVGGEPQVEFGGWGSTGIGLHEMGDEAIQFFTRSKRVFTNYGSGATGRNMTR